jgi:hypothetical protein
MTVGVFMLVMGDQDWLPLGLRAVFTGHENYVKRIRPRRRGGRGHMNEAAHDFTASADAAVPPLSCPWIPRPGQSEPAAADPGIADTEAARREPVPAYANLPEALDAALAGTGLAVRDRQFIDRLMKWDKWNAASLVSLLWKARFAGRAEAAMKPQEVETVIGALKDAARYRESGADSLGCRDCEDVPAGRCQEHSKDFARARACTDLAASMTAVRTALGKGAAGKATAPGTGAGLPQPRGGGAGYFRTVAS